MTEAEIADCLLHHTWQSYLDRHHAVEHAKLACTLCELLGWGPTEVAYSRFVSERGREEYRR